MLGAMEYLAWLGETFGTDYTEKFSSRYQGRTLKLKQAMAAIRAYEFEISRAVLEVLQETPGVRLYGLADERRLDERVPTFAFTLKGWHPRQVAEELGKQNIYVWDGHYYAVSIVERLGSGRERRYGARRAGALQHDRRDREVWRGIAKDRRNQLRQKSWSAH